jgi:hypothetical protein
VVYIYLVYFFSNLNIGSLKSDSAPVRGDGYKPRSFRPRANAKTSYSRAGGPGGGCMRHRA